MVFIKGKEDDGITYTVTYENDVYTAEAKHPHGWIASYPWRRIGHAPVCGMDIADTDKADDALERIVNFLRKSKDVILGDFIKKSSM